GTYSGPFGKSTAGINIGQVYLGWRGLDWLDITAGKMANPLFTTPMVWDSDLNPEGLSEKLKYTVGEADLFATLGQYLYQDANPTKASKGFFNLDYDESSLPFLLTWQLGANYHITTNISVKVAPTYYYYTGHGANNASGTTEIPGFSGYFVGQGSTNGILGGSAAWSGYPNGAYDGFAANQTGIRDLMIIEFPLEANFKATWADFRLFGDFAKNLRGGDRARDAFAAQSNPLLASAGLAPIPSPQTGEDTAWLAGIAMGSPDSIGLVTGALTRRHGWEVRAYWQHIEQYALDPNLIDSDFFEGRANLEGIFAAVAYGLTDNMIAVLRYGYAHRINDMLGTGGSNLDVPQMNPIDRYNILQLDLAYKF
ncbi:MAG TPA: putative porin, partial [Verrucomicrobiae bacterium]|nr:putative porin [Verrucomicrobiae bacterium]